MEDLSLGVGWSGPERRFWPRFRSALTGLDPRITILLILASYLVLGVTLLGFNRSPTQMLLTTVAAASFETGFTRLFKGRWIFPLSAIITSCSLSLLVNYAHDHFLLLAPVFFAIGSKYVFTFEGKHIYNPALAGLVFSLLLTDGLITAAPAYQWNGIESMSLFMAMLAIFLLLPKVNRHRLVLSFLATFTVLTALRALIMRWHLPFETLFLGTLSSPAFFLFTFFMITDPATSPASPKAQLKLGVLLAVVDLIFHIRQSYFTFFYAAFSIATARLLWLHLQALRASPSPRALFAQKLFGSGHYLRLLSMGALAASGVFVHQNFVFPRLVVKETSFRFAEVPRQESGVTGTLGSVLEETDPRIHHVAKWLFSVGDAVAVGDFDDDGLMDLFFTQPLKRPEDRNALYRNLGGFRFERVPLPALEAKNASAKAHGLASVALFVDVEGDGDQDLFLGFACGRHVLLLNRLRESGTADFVDASEALGLSRYSNAMAAAFFDANGDGRLDLLVGNVLPHELPGYDRPTPLNLFALPQPEYEGDVRMFDFMHSSWHMSDNGGRNDLYLQAEDGRFEPQDAEAWGLGATMWTLAIGTGDFNQDGLTDMYVANDFGPDDLYINRGGRRFESIKGSIFGSIGRDTYKGMNASVGDVDNDGFLDIYVSNVHHALQAEGSLLWTLGPPDESGVPRIEDRATELGALNETRFGWGATLTDFDNDGWLDIAQANGMVDDTPDRRFESCKDYWYVNEKVARSPPSIHRYAHRWGDIRGFCIYGKEQNRLYLNRGSERGRRFVDVASLVGLTDRTNSRAMASVDLDNDGRRDLVVTHQFAPPQIFRNELAPHAQESDSHFVGFSLEGDGGRCPRSALGSTVWLSYTEASGRSVRRRHELQSSTGFSGQDDPRAHFGLGAHAGPVDVEVDFCGQGRVRFPGLEVDRYHRLKQGAGATARR